METIENKKIEAIGLTSCEMHEECNFCDAPQNGIYTPMVGYDSGDIAYYICGKCALEKVKAGVEHCGEIKPSAKK